MTTFLATGATLFLNLYILGWLYNLTQAYMATFQVAGTILLLHVYFRLVV